MIYHPLHADYLSTLESELLRFPLDQFDDMCDTVSMAVYYSANQLRPSVSLLDDDSERGPNHILEDGELFASQALDEYDNEGWDN